VLIIAADAPDERAVSADLAQRARAVEVWQTSGIAHTQALASDPGEWSRRVSAFLDRALLGAKAPAPSAIDVVGAGHGYARADCRVA
jgi:hypothetical protein